MSNKHGFEAIKYALRQSKDGTIVSFVIHPNDLDPELQCLPIGSRVMIGWQAIGDDERAIGGGTITGSLSGGMKPVGDTGLRSTPDSKPVKRERSLAEQSAIACADKRFWEFLRWKHNYYIASEDHAANAIRTRLGISSRSELGKGNHDADNKWRQLYQEYRNYVAQLDYGEATR